MYTFMTFNLQNNMAKEESPLYWKQRLPYIVKVIQKEKPDILATQECSLSMLKSLKKELVEYEAVEVERKKNYYENDNCFFVKKGRFTILDKNIFSLSKKTNIPGTTLLGSIQPRKCSYLKVFDGKRIFCLFNVHLDFLFNSVKRRQLKILETIVKDVSDSKYNVILGDFNMPYNAILKSFEESIVVSDSVSNAFGKTSKTNWYKYPIDHIFLSNCSLLSSYKIDNEDASKASDHYPVVTRFYFEN